MSEQQESGQENVEASGGAPTDGPARPPGRGLAWLALLLALAAGGVAGWLGWERWQADSEEAVSPQRLADVADRLEDRLAEQTRRLDSISDRLGEVETRARDAEGLARRLGGRLEAGQSGFEQALGRMDALRDELEALRQRLDRLNARVAASDPGSGAQVRLELAEVEYLVRTGYRLLALESDVPRAQRALERADERLGAVDVAGVSQAREALAREIEALRSVPLPDRGALAGRLAALADNVERLPMANAMPAPGAEPGPAGEASEGGWWDASTEFLGRYFTVRRTDEAGTALPSPERLSLARQLLRLELEQARIALLRRDAEAYRAGIARARDLLTSHFDNAAPAVTRFGSSLRELADADVAPTMPDTGAALEAVSALRARHGEEG